MTRALLAACFLAPAVLSAQAVSKDAPANPAVAAERSTWRNYARYILAAAEEWPEADYAWKPTASVRSFGQLVAHVAGSQYAICAPALGENRDADEANVEKQATSKAAIVEAFKQSMTYCERAYAITDAAAMQPLQMWGNNTVRLYALSANAGHSAEHYGNVVTYMRMKGMVPPSSKGQ